VCLRTLPVTGGPDVAGVLILTFPKAIPKGGIGALINSSRRPKFFSLIDEG
jgi:hypothetical protein